MSHKKHSVFHNEPESAAIKIVFEETLQQDNNDIHLPTRENEPDINLKSERKINLLDKSQGHTSNNLKEDGIMDNSVISLTKQFLLVWFLWEIYIYRFSTRLGSPIKGKKSSVLLAKKFGHEEMSPEHKNLQVVQLLPPPKKPKKKWMALSCLFLFIGFTCLTIGVIYIVLSDSSHFKTGIIFSGFGVVCLLPSSYYSIKVCHIFRTNKKNKRKKPLQDVPV